MLYTNMTVAALLVVSAAVVVKIGGQTLHELAVWEVRLVAEAGSEECGCSRLSTIVPAALSEAD